MKQTPKQKVTDENRVEATRRLATLDPQMFTRMEQSSQERGRGHTDEQAQHTDRRDRELEAER